MHFFSLPVPSLSLFAPVLLFPPFSAPRTSLSAYLILSPFPPPSPLRYRRPPPPTSSSTSCGSRPFRSSSNSPFHGREKRTGSCPSRTLFHPAFIHLPSVGLSDPAAASLSRSLSTILPRSLALSPTRTGHPSLSGFPRCSRARTRSCAYMHLTCTCTHADSAFRVLASADKSRWRLRVGDREGRRKREKGWDREREREKENAGGSVAGDGVEWVHSRSACARVR